MTDQNGLKNLQAWKEASVVINGQEATKGQVTALRVAVEAFAESLAQTGLGEDKIGKAITAGYLKNLAALRKLLAGSP